MMPPLAALLPIFTLIPFGSGLLRIDFPATVSGILSSV